MIHRRAAFAVVLAHAVLAGCANEPQRPREQIFLIPQEQVQAPVDSDPAQNPVALSDTSVVDQTSSETEESRWSSVASNSSDTLVDQSSQNLALALASTDRNTRIEYLDAAASFGSGQAHYELAKVYTEGVDRPRDLKLAQEHLVAAASANDPEATRVIGWQMIKGQGGHEQNINGGVAVMEMAVTKSVRTQRELGSLYGNLYADYKLNDPAKGEAYLIQAYSAGDVPAAVALGKLYIQQGRQAEAVAPLAFASDKNDPAAAKLLASIGGASAGVDATAQHGNPDGSSSETFYQQASAIMLRKHSIDDEAKSYALFSLAADMGHNLARAELGAISGVKVLMDKQLGAGWLEAEKQSLLYGAQQ